MPSFQQLPDNTGCAHKSLGLEGPTAQHGDFYVAYCSDCKKTVAARVDKAGKRTGEYFLTEP